MTPRHHAQSGGATIKSANVRTLFGAQFRRTQLATDMASHPILVNVGIKRLAELVASFADFRRGGEDQRLGRTTS